MRRRQVLTAASASLLFPTPALARGITRMRMVTDWPDAPGMLQSARRLAQTVEQASDGRLVIDVSAAGSVVRPMETFDAVGAGVAEMFHSHIGYFEARAPALHFFSGVPFGLTASELVAWVRFGGGQALWDELCAGFGIKPLLCASTGPQMGGWFRKPVERVEDFRGLRYRMFGLGAEVYRRLGAAVVMIPAGEIVKALQSGAIDACEWIGPWLDTEMGLHEAAQFYYSPGWHEPGTGIALGINLDVWTALAAADRVLIETAAAAEFAVSRADFDTRNAAALQWMRAGKHVTFSSFPEPMLQVFAEHSAELTREIGAVDALSEKILKSHNAFRQSQATWTELGTTAFLEHRGARLTGR